MLWSLFVESSFKITLNVICRRRKRFSLILNVICQQSICFTVAFAVNVAVMHPNTTPKLLLDTECVVEYKGRVKKELGDTNEHIRSVRAQIDAAVRVIRDLTKGGEVAPAQQSTSRRVSNNKELLVEIRKNIGSARVDGHTTAKPVVEKVVEVVKEAFTCKGEKIYEVTKAIKDTLEAHFLGDWNIYLLWNNIGYFFHSVHQDGFVELKFNKATVAVYRSVESVSNACLERYLTLT